MSMFLFSILSYKRVERMMRFSAVFGGVGEVPHASLGHPSGMSLADFSASHLFHWKQRGTKHST